MPWRMTSVPKIRMTVSIRPSGSTPIPPEKMRKSESFLRKNGMMRLHLSADPFRWKAQFLLTPRCVHGAVWHNRKKDMESGGGNCESFPLGFAEHRLLHPCRPENDMANNDIYGGMRLMSASSAEKREEKSVDKSEYPCYNA